MPLLKENQSDKPPIRPKTPKPQTLLTWRDGLNFGIGFGLALTVVLPLIVVLVSCFIMSVLAATGSTLQSIFGG